MKKTKHNFLKKFILFGVIPLCLLFLWLFASILVFTKPYFVLITPHASTAITKWIGKEIVKNTRIQSQFTTSDNNLGTIDVRFFNFNRINSDSIVFKIKEKTAHDWYYQNSYTTNQFLPNEFFTFGFPPIKNSKDKVYIFEIQSKDGKHGNAITISNISPQVASIYTIEKNTLKNPAILTYFVVRKALQIFSNTRLLESSSVFILPLIIYLVVILFFFFPQKIHILLNSISNNERSQKLILFYKSHKILKHYSFFQIFFILFLLFACIDIFFLQISNIFIVLCFYLLWIMLIRLGKLSSSFSFSFAFICLFFHVTFLLFKNQQISDNFSTWFDIFFIIGIFQSVFQKK